MDRKAACARASRPVAGASDTGTSQQYTDAVDLGFRFIGVMIYTQVDPGPNPLAGLVAELLTASPDLLHEPKLAKDWAALLKSHVPPGSELHTRINDDYVAWNFRNREKEFVDRFAMTIIVQNRKHGTCSRRFALPGTRSRWAT